MHEILNKVSRFNYYNYKDLSYNITQYSSIDAMCEKNLIYHDNNKKLYWKYNEEEDAGIYLF